MPPKNNCVDGIFSGLIGRFMTVKRINEADWADSEGAFRLNFRQA